MPVKKCIERWKVIPGWSAYEASTLGKIRRIVPAISKKAGKCLKTKPNNAGYLVLHLSMHGRAKWVYVHHLIALTFKGPRPPGKFVSHENDRKTDNSARNLKYRTPTKNVALAIQRGLWKPACGENHVHAKLNARKVRRIRQLAAEGLLSHAAIGRKFGVTRTAVDLVVQRKSWKHVA